MVSQYSSSLPSPSPLKGLKGSGSGTPSNKPFYAGAKFETNPSCMVLPPPPTHWTTSSTSTTPTIQRSQSQPSTPTIKSALTQFTPIDLAAFFGSPTTTISSTSSKSVPMAKSFPGQALDKKKKKQFESDSSDEELKEILNEGTKKAVILTNKKEAVPSTTVNTSTSVLMVSPRKTVNTDDLKAALGMIATTNISPSSPVNLELTCHGAVTPVKNFKKMSDQLKSLMKVA